MKPQDIVPIPHCMAKLPLDPRGYPIPAGIWIDQDGRPHFTINDEERRQKVVVEERCGICHGKLFRGKWFVGGPLSCFSQRGRYIDPPMHRECATYALQVCPYLAAPVYSGRIDSKKVPKGQTGQIFNDPTMIPDRPDVFVLAGFPRYKLHKGVLSHNDTGHRVIGWQYIEPKGPIIDVQFWSKGKILTDEQGEHYTRQAFQKVGEEYGTRRAFDRSGGKKRPDRTGRKASVGG